ncbi:MAG: flagellar hook-basal body complex protein [Pseudomonadota bacterium]
MNNASYAVLSRQAGLAREMTSIANNIANASTTGFRSETHLFSEYIRKLGAGDLSVSQSNTAGRFFNAAPGALVKTDGPLDFAIEGEGYFLIETPGGERLTRAGDFLFNRQGELSTTEGFRVLSDGGAPIATPIDTNNIVLAIDGTLSADGAPIAKLAIVDADPTTLTREGASLFRYTEDVTPLETSRLRQGYLESANVNSVAELGRMIEVQRAYELNQQLLRDEDDRITRTIESIQRQ